MTDKQAGLTIGKQLELAKREKRALQNRVGETTGKAFNDLLNRLSCLDADIERLYAELILENDALRAELATYKERERDGLFPQQRERRLQAFGAQPHYGQGCRRASAGRAG